jgi:Uncharacterized protein conserved in bacteria
VKSVTILLLVLLWQPALALEDMSPDEQRPELSAEQSRLFRAWFVQIVSEQIRRPSPRWQHRDCAGLVRFAVDDTLRAHDERWIAANGLQGKTLPPPLQLTPQQQALRQSWRDIDGDKKAFVTALTLIQENSHFVGKEINAAEPGDLLFFDQGDEQHLMIWMGSYIAYHTGRVTPQDNGLRAVTVAQLTQWKDTRWQPVGNNPNFIGLFRLGFLSH